MATKDRTGITVIHQRGCPSKGWLPCKCKRGYRAQVYDVVTGRTAYKTFPSEQGARAYRHDRIVALRSGSERVTAGVPLADVVAAWFKGVADGTVRARGGHPYKPSVVRQYEQKWLTILEPRFGRVKVNALRTPHIQALVDEMLAAGAKPSTVNNTITPLRVFLRLAIRREWATVDPCKAVELPSGETARDRVVPPREALAMLEQVPATLDRAIWATAFFTGLRRGELMALRWEDVDLVGRHVWVRRSYDPPSGQFGVPKNRRERQVGIPGVLVSYLAALDTTEGLVFRRATNRHQPFDAGTLASRMRGIWSEPVTLHECRHTYASVMIAAGINIKTLSEMMGHAQVSITWDRYGHLMPGATLDAMSLMDSYLEKELA